MKIQFFFPSVSSFIFFVRGQYKSKQNGEKKRAKITTAVQLKNVLKKEKLAQIKSERWNDRRFKPIANENVKHNKIIDRLMGSICKLVPIAFDVCVLLQANGSECAMRCDEIWIFFCVCRRIVFTTSKQKSKRRKKKNYVHIHSLLINSMRSEKWRKGQNKTEHASVCMWRPNKKFDFVRDEMIELMLLLAF